MSVKQVMTMVLTVSAMAGFGIPAMAQTVLIPGDTHIWPADQPRSVRK